MEYPFNQMTQQTQRRLEEYGFVNWSKSVIHRIKLLFLEHWKQNEVMQRQFALHLFMMDHQIHFDLFGVSRTELLVAQRLRALVTTKAILEVHAWCYHDQ